MLFYQKSLVTNRKLSVTFWIQINFEYPNNSIIILIILLVQKIFHEEYGWCTKYFWIRLTLSDMQKVTTTLPWVPEIFSDCGRRYKGWNTVKSVETITLNSINDNFMNEWMILHLMFQKGPPWFPVISSMFQNKVNLVTIWRAFHWKSHK